MAALINLFVDTGFHLERASEGGEPVPIVFSLRTRKPDASAC